MDNRFNIKDIVLIVLILIVVASIGYAAWSEFFARKAKS